MFSDGTPFFGTGGFFLTGADNSPMAGNDYQGVFDSLGLFLGGGFSHLGAQLLGILLVSIYTVLFSLIVWSTIKAVTGIRTPLEEEIKDLDIGEHGMEAYSGFLKEEVR